MSRIGFPWTEKEENQLREEYQEKSVSIDTIADFHCRPSSAIYSRLQKMQIPILERYLFVLALRGNRFFIGITSKPEALLREFVFDRKVGQNPWLDLYPVVGKVEQSLMTNLFELDQKVKFYMYHKGLNRVRGGSYSAVHLTSEQINSIQKELALIYQLDQCSCL